MVIKLKAKHNYKIIDVVQILAHIKQEVALISILCADQSPVLSLLEPFDTQSNLPIKKRRKKKGKLLGA